MSSTPSDRLQQLVSMEDEDLIWLLRGVYIAEHGTSQEASVWHREVTKRATQPQQIIDHLEHETVQLAEVVTMDAGTRERSQRLDILSQGEKR